MVRQFQNESDSGDILVLADVLDRQDETLGNVDLNLPGTPVSIYETFGVRFQGELLPTPTTGTELPFEYMIRNGEKNSILKKIKNGGGFTADIKDVQLKRFTLIEDILEWAVGPEWQQIGEQRPEIIDVSKPTATDNLVFGAGGSFDLSKDKGIYALFNKKTGKYVKPQREDIYDAIS